jgi:protein farnesyltransferase subunit beta
MAGDDNSPKVILDPTINPVSAHSAIRIPDFDTLLEMVNGSYDSFSNCAAPLGEQLSDTISRKMETELDIQMIYEDIMSKGSDTIPTLNRNHHAAFCHGVISGPIPGMFSKLDASKPWVSFWLMNAAVLLKAGLSSQERSNASSFLISILDKSFTDDNSYYGFGGGAYQLPHLAASYAAILTLALTEDEQAWGLIDVKKIKTWLLEMKQPNGSFSMHQGGESDTRAVYCALCIASLLNILDDELTEGTAEWLIRCQTYEGGFAGEPGDEAHGGYTYCGVAALLILLSPGELLKSGLDLDSLIKWTVDRQYSLEGGFSGRSNKLVDGCYSHWVGGTCALLEAIFNFQNNEDSSSFKSLIDRQRLQNYVLCCCQDKMGLRDKPGCRADFYHTNYVLCGLSMCQYYQVYDKEAVAKYGNAFFAEPVEIEDSNVVDIDSANKVAALDAIFGLPYGYAMKMHNFFLV